MPAPSADGWAAEDTYFCVVLKISVDIPSIDMISEDFSDLEESANEEIHKLCQDYADEATKRAKAYRQAFLDTGGTQEEWEAHNIEIKV